MSHESTIYPPHEKGVRPLYYVEFNRGGIDGEFTLFRRQFMYSEDALVELEQKSPEDFPMLRMCNEVHPWNIYTANYGPPNTVPDRKWVEWMVDALNNELDRNPIS